MADTEQKTPPPVYTPPSQLDPAELAKAFEAEGIVEPKPVAATPAPVAATPAPADEGVPTLLKLAKDKDAQRKAAEAKELETARPYMDALKAIPPHMASAVARAVQLGDPVGALTALGFTHSQYNARLLGVADEKPEEKPAESGDPKVTKLEQELAALRQERDSEKINSSRQQAMGLMKSTLKDDPKFALLNGLGDYEGVERVLIQHYQQYGSLPGATFEESVRLAAEVYEYELKQQAEKWRSVLTPAQNPAPVSGTKAPEPLPSTGTVQTRTLTNANTTAPAAARTVPKTRAEIMAAIAADRDDLLE